jgi:hypothetical protein
MSMGLELDVPLVVIVNKAGELYTARVGRLTGGNTLLLPVRCQSDFTCLRSINEHARAVINLD